MKKYYFSVIIAGSGPTPEEAWNEAKEFLPDETPHYIEAPNNEINRIK